MPSGCASGSRSSPAARSASKAWSPRRATGCGRRCGSRRRDADGAWRARAAGRCRAQRRHLAFRAARGRHRAAAQGAARRRRRDRGAVDRAAAACTTPSSPSPARAAAREMGEREADWERRHDRRVRGRLGDRPARFRRHRLFAQLHPVPARRRCSCSAAMSLVGLWTDDADATPPSRASRSSPTPPPAQALRRGARDAAGRAATVRAAAARSARSSRRRRMSRPRRGALLADESGGYSAVLSGTLERPVADRPAQGRRQPRPAHAA